MPSQDGLVIKPLDTRSRAAWNDFVTTTPAATFCHRAEWADVLHGVFGFENHYLYAEQDGSIVGVLPLAMVRSRLFGNTLCSTPYCVYGGAVGVERAAIDALEREAARLATELPIDYLELRSTERTQPDWPSNDLYFTFRKALSADDDVNMKAIPRKQRAMVRKGIEAGLDFAFDDGLERFYHAFATSVRNLGTPVFPRRYFAALREVFGKDCSVATVTHDGGVVSSVLSFYFRDTILPYYAGGMPQARALKAFDFMYWKLMCSAVAAGYRVFDYGRSKAGSGNYSFKKNW
ncbi:MAG: FemAB family PEP-CTERM system-associated protein, partial [Gammaproteobacteria bacterium]